MTHTHGISGSRSLPMTARLSIVVAIAALVARFPLRGAAQDLALVVLLVAAAVATLACLVCAVDRARGAAVTGAVASLGLAGSVLYLDAIPKDSAAIPLAGVGILLLSLVGMAVSFFTLPRGGTAQ